MVKLVKDEDRPVKDGVKPVKHEVRLVKNGGQADEG